MKRTWLKSFRLSSLRRPIAALGLYGPGGPGGLWRQAASLLPLFALAVGAVFLAGVLTSCGEDANQNGKPFRPVTSLGGGGISEAGVPIVRVRITPQPLAVVQIGASGGYRLRVGGQVIAHSPSSLEATRVTRCGRAWTFGGTTAEGDDALLEPVGSSVCLAERAAYRGSLRFLPADQDRIILVNSLDLESYLAGVLPKELYKDWSPQTYRALAVAARTFARFNMYNYGASHDYDLGSDQGSQMYGGLSAETPKAWAALRDTRGKMLVYGPAGQERIFLAQYSAACGGIVNGAYVIREAPMDAPLVGGQVCNDCRECTRYRWPPVLLGKEDVYRAVLAAYPSASEMGGLSEIRVAEATPYGRMVWVDLVGPTGRSIRIRAEDLRLALLRGGTPAAKGLYSMNCTIRDMGRAIQFADGRGFGHGVGVCQWGAEGKAQKGWTAEQILGFYYPGAKLATAY
jgi:stage II sporulation protein D